MIVKYYQVDSFTNKIFSGNPAAVVILETSLPDSFLKDIAKESGLPETAFLLKRDTLHYDLRWFTPDIEMDLCGHATLAAAHILFSENMIDGDKVVFHTNSGDLTVSMEWDLLVMDFPLRAPQPAVLPIEIFDSLNIKPEKVLKSRDYILVYNSQREVERIEIERAVFDEINIDPGGVIITAPGNDCDFVSRFFTPQATIFEDPVTGSAHCSLAPYWGERLNKTKMKAKQLSARGGEIFCETIEGRVLLKGGAITYLRGLIYI